MDPLSLKKLNQAIESRKAALLLTEISKGDGQGRDRVIYAGDKIAGDMREAVDNAFKTGKSKRVTINEVEFFLNVHLPAPKIIVIGAVHISQALAKMAQISGFDIIIIDPRSAFSNEARFENVTLIADWPETAFENITLDTYCALVAVCHDPKIDDLPILKALECNCFYVGALGSRKTHKARCERLSAFGVGQSELDTIHAPIGLNIGASSPQEIAVAIMAEIIAEYRKRDL